ncbi:glycoside hydrolase family 43 protein [Sphingomonas yantingensis]|uniref:GH43 family beta-xylosidase n=1 Tax=Sphingomonas yantingensis TaxID=1241761 RepID=A0A7W9AQM5_9SPHN|nr:glycoside hydrolase family 43 protein [Sphingomonas yantingensis]MBB5698838.1 GH43 family beta-xylosidase [Sphingomonas yantingensis]
MRRAALVLAATLLVAASDARTLVNPILPSGADPWIVEANGTFYFMATRGDRLAIRTTRNLARLADAPEQVVWRAPASGPNSASIWAPELHRIDGRWFLYYTASDRAADDDAHRGVWVLENRSPDPLKGEWIDRGRVNSARPGIDGTTFTVHGRRYFAYSPYVGPDSVIAIARMANPWTLAGREAIIARPDQLWERQGGRQILEGPAFLKGPDGGLHIAYSGSACWSDDYAVGLLSAAPGADPMRPESWRKTPRPVLAKSPATAIWAPGHNGFFIARGRTWIVYHANNAEKLGCGNRRAPHVQEVTWTRDGEPVFARPAAGPAPAP